MKKSFRICIASNTNMSIGHEPLGKQKVDFFKGIPTFKHDKKKFGFDLLSGIEVRDMMKS
jgi:hypothetical protein